jgi:ligand-binding SRPBCC domain-containing protein
MKIYHFKQNQFLPVSLEEAWHFFSSPVNLARITPPDMTFKIEYISGNAREMYEGQIIRYKIGILPGITTDWMTEITHIHKPLYFVDEQRFGPYALWHHQHWFKEVAGGVEMTDEVNYAIPLGFLGRIANAVLVRNRLKAIFQFRYQTIEKLFCTEKTNAKIFV